MRTPNSRVTAALLHLAISALVVGSVFLVVYLVWYPPPLFQSAGGRHLFLVLALVDIGLGPLITLIIYRRGKPGLRFDLATIGLLQLAALGFGAHVVYQARPAWIVFAHDRFDLIRANQVVERSLKGAAERFRHISSTGPRIAAARQPDDPQERLAISLSAVQGIDITSHPHLYREYAEVRHEAAAKAKPLAELRALNPGEQDEVARLAARLGRPEAQLGFLPIRAGKTDLAMVIDAATGDILGMSSLKPWKP
jgi:hypothetical protein